MAVNKIILNRLSFPPGSPREFIDAILRINDQQNAAAGTADDAKDAADGAQTVAEAQKTRNDQQDIVLTDHSSQINALRTDVDNQGDSIININNNAVKTNTTTLQVMQGALSVNQELRISNVKVLGARNTGWAATTGTQTKGGLNSDLALPAGAAYSQAELTAIANAVIEARRHIAGLIAALTSHGVIGP